MMDARLVFALICYGIIAIAALALLISSIVDMWKKR